MQKKVQWHVKAYHIFMVYLPVVLIFALIFLVYFAYIFTYINVLIRTESDGIDSSKIIDYPFIHTSTIESGYRKGVALISIVTFCLFMLTVSLLKTIFLNPGYFPTPIDLEYRIILKNTNPKTKKKISGDRNGKILFKF
jgi:hypothetical protein